MKRIIFVSTLLATSIANALVVSEDVFLNNGGDLSNVKESLKYVNESLREKSYDKPFMTVGWIGGCTATWLGSDEDWTYVLSAAHCGWYDSEENETHKDFTGYDGEVYASTGTFHVHPYRLNKPSGHGGASTDIAVLKLKTVKQLKDPDGNPVPQPLLYNGQNELNNKVMFVGYGSWGVGTDTSGSYWPATGERRLYGESLISGIWEADHGIGAGYDPQGGTDQWSRVAAGDSGSAWWQLHDNKYTIIATTNGGHAYASTGARVSKYVPWIQSIYPEVKTLINPENTKPNLTETNERANQALEKVYAASVQAGLTDLGDCSGYCNGHPNWDRTAGYYFVNVDGVKVYVRYGSPLRYSTPVYPYEGAQTQFYTQLAGINPDHYNVGIVRSGGWPTYFIDKALPETLEQQAQNEGKGCFLAYQPGYSGSKASFYAVTDGCPEV